MGAAEEKQQWAGWLRALLALLAVVALVIAVRGCTGCRNDDEVAEKQKETEEQEKLKKEKNKPKAPFAALKLNLQPGDVQFVGKEREIRSRAVKPGHWTAGTIEGLANNFDFSGELRTEAVDRTGSPVGIDRTAFHLVTSRPAALVKGQKKQLDFSLLVPQGNTNTWLQSALLDRHGGGSSPDTEPLKHMAAYEYYLVVLSNQPGRYNYLKRLDSVRPPSGELEQENPDLYYRVVLPQLTPRVPLPSQSLCWTSTAYILWDDAEPTLLDPAQQQAMLDWLHWGGQLVISGPLTLDALERSVLAPYLPAKWVSARQLDTASLAELDREWTVSGAPLVFPASSKPWVGIAFQKHPQASFLPGTGELVAERRVGRGRIVLSAFRLSQPELIAWPSFDSFFNACILRRPGRDFKISRGTLAVDWEENAVSRWDPLLITSLRYFSRDALAKHQPGEPADPQQRDPFAATGPQSPRVVAWAGQELDHGARRIEALKQSGPAGWNDASEVSAAARRALQDAAGIVIPTRRFVLKVLGVYLLVLVPANWLVFRLLRRIELAWVAAPVIAVIGTIVVVRLAQLDIGFARSQTEVAVLELHGGYPRAHLTRYTALYTSLSSSYNVSFDDPSAVALPLSNDFALISGQRLSNVNYRRDQNVQLTDIPIRSNSTTMLHSEQMYDVGGDVSLDDDGQGGLVIHNRTKLTFLGVRVVRNSADEPEGFDVASIGTLAPDGETRLTFAAPSDEGRALTHSGNVVNLNPLVKLAGERGDLTTGDVRLVGWLDGGLPGLHVEPAAPQIRQATLVIAHLRFGERERPFPDYRIKPEMANILGDEEDFERGNDPPDDNLEDQATDRDAKLP